MLQLELENKKTRKEKKHLTLHRWSLQLNPIYRTKQIKTYCCSCLDIAADVEDLPQINASANMDLDILPQTKPTSQVSIYQLRATVRKHSHQRSHSFNKFGFSKSLDE